MKQEWAKNLLQAAAGSGRRCPPPGLLEKSGAGAQHNRLKNGISPKVIARCGEGVAFWLPPFLGGATHASHTPPLGVLVGHLSIPGLPNSHP